MDNMDSYKIDEKRKKGWFKHFFFGAMAMQALWNVERQMNTGFMYGISKTLDDIYPSPDEVESKKTAYRRSLQFFNCTPQLTSFILGMSAAVEEEATKNKEGISSDMIAGIKTALMGPFSGVGDSFFQGIVRVIAFGIGLALAKQGSILGPVIAMLISIGVSVPITYYGGKLGYLNGKRILVDLEKNNVMEKMMYPLNVLGLVVIGGMSASLINLTTPLAYGEILQLQSILDSIMPKMIPLVFTGFMYWRIKKGAKPMRMLLICLLLGVIFQYFGIFSVL